MKGNGESSPSGKENHTHHLTRILMLGLQSGMCVLPGGGQQGQAQDDPLG